MTGYRLCDNCALKYADCKGNKSLEKTRCDYYKKPDVFNARIASERIAELERELNKIVRCKDCIHWLQHEQFGFDEDNDEYHDYCALLVPDDDYYAYERKADDFCSYGERR